MYKLKQNILNLLNIIDLLDTFPSEYVKDTDKWFKITCALRSANLYKVLNKWSKQSHKYNTWRIFDRYSKYVKPLVDTTIQQYYGEKKNDKSVEYITAYEPIEPLANTYGIKTRESNNRYVHENSNENSFRMKTLTTMIILQGNQQREQATQQPQPITQNAI